MCGVSIIFLKRTEHEARRNPYVKTFTCPPNTTCSVGTLYVCTERTLDASLGGKAVQVEGMDQIAELAAADRDQLREQVELDFERRHDFWSEHLPSIEEDLRYRRESDARRRDGPPR